MSDEQQVKKGRGCFFYGCLTLVVLFLILVITTIIGVRYAVNKMVANYTEDHPATLPKLEASSAEIASLEARVKNFSDALNNGKPTEPLVLSEREINELIANDPNFVAWKGHIYVSLAGDQVQGQVSIPLEKVMNFLHGRFLNGSATLKVKMEDGLLYVSLQSLQVKGLDMPEKALANLRAQNLARDANTDTNNSPTLRKLESIEIKDGAVIVKARSSK